MGFVVASSMFVPSVTFFILCCPTSFFSLSRLFFFKSIYSIFLISFHHYLVLCRTLLCYCITISSFLSFLLISVFNPSSTSPLGSFTPYARLPSPPLHLPSLLPPPLLPLSHPSSIPSFLLPSLSPTPTPLPSGTAWLKCRKSFAVGDSIVLFVATILLRDENEVLWPEKK